MLNSKFSTKINIESRYKLVNISTVYKDNYFHIIVTKMIVFC